MAQTSKEGDECGGNERGTHYTIQETVRAKRAVQKEESIRVVQWERKTRCAPRLCGKRKALMAARPFVPEAGNKIIAGRCSDLLSPLRGWVVNASCPWADRNHCHSCWDFEFDRQCDEE